MDRLNQLKQYIEFYNQNRLGPGSPYVNANGTGFARGGAVAYNAPMMAANWAQEQVGLDNMQQRQEQSRVTPNFFGSNSEAGAYSQPQYVPPSYTPGQENPYQPRAMELNGITNQLRKLMSNQGQRSSGMTVGVRG